MPKLPDSIFQRVEIAGTGVVIKDKDGTAISDIKPPMNEKDPRKIEKYIEAEVDKVIDPMNGQKYYWRKLDNGELAWHCLTNPYDDKGKLIDPGKWWEV